MHNHTLECSHQGLQTVQQPRELLLQWISARLPTSAVVWLEQSIARIRASDRDAELFLAFSLAPRKTGKRDLGLSAIELNAAQAGRSGWCPQDWSMDQAARIYLLLAGAAAAERFARQLQQLCATGDVAELVALYRGLPLYPDPERLRLQAAEGLRSNMKAVFEAVAHRNPYPSEQLAESAWNQLVLKALFVGSTLDPIIGLDERANPRLARMLCDYAHERWSAGRTVSPELWRCVGPFATAAMVGDLAHVLEHGTPSEQAAVILALRRAPNAAATALLRTRPDLVETAASGAFTWRTLAMSA